MRVAVNQMLASIRQHVYAVVMWNNAVSLKVMFDEGNSCLY